MPAKIVPSGGEKLASDATAATTTTTTPFNVTQLVAPMQALHDTCENHTYEWRVTQLKRLRLLLVEHWAAFEAALQADLGKCRVEAAVMELIMVRTDLDHTLAHLKKWMKPQPIATPMTNLPGFTRLEQRPLCGPAVLVIGPSNYPVSLVLHPTIGALAAGNPVVVKPSELTRHCEQLMARLIPQYFEPNAVQCVTGGIPEASALLHQQWGHIFFTGSEQVGRIVAKSAAETLSPVTLELGGKAPVYIDAETCPPNLQLVVDRILWAKTVNAGQTCAASDTLIVHESMIGKLLPAMKASILRQYGEDPSKSDFGRIVSPRHARRLVDLIVQVEQSMDDTKTTKIVVGGSKSCDADNCYVAPTIILNPPKDCRLLQEEIFGPILPVVTVQSRDEAVQFMKQMPGTPLCSYIFTSSEAVFAEINRQVPAGSTMRNDCLFHLASQYLPFGGLGSSGYGRYHGKYTFDTFSHTQPIMFRPCFRGSDFNYLRSHPFPQWKQTLLMNFAVGLPGIPNLNFSLLWKSAIVRIVFVLIWKFVVPAEIRAMVWNAVADRVQDAGTWLRPVIE